MTRYDPETGLPIPERKRRKHLAPRLISCAVLIAALAFGAGVSIREYETVRIVPKTGAEHAPIYTRAVPADGAELLPAAPSVRTASDIYASLAPSCVGVRTDMTRTNVFGQVTSGAITGSGFLLSSDGYILTNNHVIETAAQKKLKVKVMLYSGEEYEAKIIGGDAKSDVALLKIDAHDLPAVTIGDFSRIQVGQTVFAVGNPLGELTYSMTAGIVSALDRTITTEANTAINMFQIDAAINNGNSGGPVCDERGEIIGIASAKYASSGVEGLGFAIPIDDALKVVDDLLAYGYVRGRALLGVSVANATAYNYEPGALIVSVTEGGACDRAGLAEGDIIVEANGSPVSGTADLLELKKDWRPGETVELTVHRGEKRMTVRVTLDEEKPG